MDLMKNVKRYKKFDTRSVYVRKLAERRKNRKKEEKRILREKKGSIFVRMWKDIFDAQKRVHMSDKKD
jgi:hypothetical protein